MAFNVPTAQQWMPVALWCTFKSSTEDDVRWQWIGVTCSENRDPSLRKQPQIIFPLSCATADKAKDAFFSQTKTSKPTTDTWDSDWLASRWKFLISNMHHAAGVKSYLLIYNPALFGFARVTFSFLTETIMASESQSLIVQRNLF